jgi:hypothetical protein
MINSCNDFYDENIPVPTPVPTLVLMLRHGEDNHDLYLNHEVLVHITPYVYRMNFGEFTDYEGLFDQFLLDITPRWGYQNVLNRAESDLVAQEKIPLELVDYNGKLNEIYRRI